MLVRKSIKLSLIFILKLLLDVLKWISRNECLSQHRALMADFYVIAHRI